MVSKIFENLNRTRSRRLAFRWITTIYTILGLYFPVRGHCYKTARVVRNGRVTTPQCDHDRDDAQVTTQLTSITAVHVRGGRGNVVSIVRRGLLRTRIVCV